MDSILQMAHKYKKILGSGEYADIAEVEDFSAMTDFTPPELWAADWLKNEETNYH